MDATTRDQILDTLNASARHDISKLQECISKYAFDSCRVVDVQDPETGRAPLHAAVDSCRIRNSEPDLRLSISKDDTTINDHDEKVDLEREKEIKSARETINLLLENGAIWNTLDKNDETAGCIAYRKGLDELYVVLVDAGVRAEMLLNRLEGGYMELTDGEGVDVDEEEQDDVDNHEGTEKDETREQEEQDPDSSSSLPSIDPPINTTDVKSSTYLSSTLSLTSSKLLDSESNAVMMSWEKDIMSQSATAIISSPNLTVLNIGFGMGIIDTLIQSSAANKPSSHHIVEAHPDVLRQIEVDKWHERPGIVIHAGKWQDVLASLAAEGLSFDAIYFDTFAESYSDFREFMSEHVISLLSETGRWSFFNGMGADRQISYDVYQKVVELDLFEAGFDVEWVDIDVPAIKGEWEGVRRRYWDIKSYRLPICRFMD